MGSYVFQPRGNGTSYTFRVAIPKELHGRFKSPSGKPLWRITEGLGTHNLADAKRLATKLRAHWLTVFERAKQTVALTLGEIEDLAAENYRGTLARLANEAATSPDPDEACWLPAEISLREQALDRGDPAPVRHEIEAAERRYGIEIDTASPTFTVLGKALLRAQIAAFKGRLRALSGETSDKPATFLGADGIDTTTLKPITLRRPIARLKSEHGPWALFEQWIAEAKPAASTVNRWRAVFLNLQSRFTSKEIIEDDARDWARGLVSTDRTPQTVSDVWVSAARRIYKWAVEQKLAASNPFATIKITAPEKMVTREKAFTPKEAEKILRAASAIDAGGNTFKGALRWVPWLCAYSGARAGEITQLRGQDIQRHGGFHTIRLTPDAGTIKAKMFRDVPLHGDLIAQGFLDFVKSRGKGPLFYNVEEGKPEAGDVTNPRRPRAVKTRERLAAWVRELGITDKEVSPTRSWRHTFKQIAERSGISERISDAITGHAPTTAGRGYGKPTIEDMAEAHKKFPRYKT